MPWPLIASYPAARRAALRCCCTLGLAMSAPWAAWATDPAPFVLPALPAPSPSAPALPATVQLEQVVFVGNTVVDTATLEQLAAPYLHRPLDESDLENLRRAVTQHYVDQGYVNSGAVFANPALVGSVLTLQLVEGQLSAVQWHGLEGLHPQYVQQRLTPEPGAVLHLDTLRTRFQRLLDDPLFTRMQARLRPGDALGQAVLDVDVQRARPYQLTLATHNHRPASIGTQALELSGWVRNLSGRGDVLDASVQQATPAHGGLRSQWQWKMPLGARTWVAWQGNYGQSAVVQEPMRALDFSSQLQQQELGLEQVLHQSLHHQLSAGLHYGQRTHRTWLAGTPFSLVPGEPQGQTRISGWRFWQEYSYRTENQALALRATLHRNHNNLQSWPGAGLPPAAPLAADQRAQLWLLQGQYARKILDNGTQWIVRATVQTSSQRLLALDRLAIGGAATVRGFLENQLVRDQGQILNLEFDIPLLRGSGPSPQWSLIPFYDIGQGRNQGEASTRIASVGLATRVRWQGMRLDLAAGHPVQGARSKGGSWQHQGIHLYWGYDFF